MAFYAHLIPLMFYATVKAMLNVCEQRYKGGGVAVTNSSLSPGRYFFPNSVDPDSVTLMVPDFSIVRFAKSLL